MKQLVKLRDRRPRDEAGVFLVEGYREIRRALEKGVKLQEIYFSPEWFLGENEPALIAQAEAAGAVAFELTKDAFAKVAYRERPDGLLAVAPQWRRALSDLPAKENPFYLVVEAIEKPGNLGTILRSADAAGCDAVIVCDPVTDIFNPNVVRASTGVLFSVPLVVEESTRVQIFIGEESGYRAFDGCSIVTSTYGPVGETMGVLGVVGPTRMPYERVIPIVDLTAKMLGSALNSL